MSRQRSTRRFITFALAIVMGLATAACASGGRLPDAVEAEVAPTTVPTPGQTFTCPDDQVLLDGETQPSYEPDGPLPAPGEMPDGSTMARIEESTRLRVGVSADTLLFSARDPQDNRIKGFDIDVLLEVAKAIFDSANDDEAYAQLDLVVIPYSQRIPKLRANDVDIVAHTMTINCVRWQQIAFSSEYFHAGQRVLVKIDSPVVSIQELNDAQATVCVPEGSTNLENLDVYPGVQAVPKPDISDCLVALQRGEVEAITGDDTVLAGLAAQDPATKVVGDQFSDEPYGLGINEANVDLVQFVNGVLEEMRADGRWAALYEKWLVIPAGFPPDDPPPAKYGREVP